MQCMELGKPDSTDAVHGGETLQEWLSNAESRTGPSLLIVCGAGVSLDPAIPGPTGKALCDEYEQMLRSRSGVTIPNDIVGDLGKLYDHFCYNASSGTPKFDESEYQRFKSAITTRSSRFSFTGPPGTIHKILERESCSDHGNVRVYSLNMDQFFELAGCIVMHGPSAPKDVEDAAALADNPNGDNAPFMNWRVLAAHGKVATSSSSAVSVWSHTVLSGNLDPRQDDWERELRVLRAAVRCIRSVPYRYSHVVFAGICYPVHYLVPPLLDMCLEGFEWMWVNPCHAPQRWLLGVVGDQRSFTASNGCWVKAGLREVLINSCFARYRNWIRVSCRANSLSTPLVEQFTNSLGTREFFVRSVDRARRIFYFSDRITRCDGLQPDGLAACDESRDPFDPPHLRSSSGYDDRALGQCLETLHGRGITIHANPGGMYPRFTVAISGTDVKRSAQVFRVDPSVAPERIADAIAGTLVGVGRDPAVDNVTIMCSPSEYDLTPIMRSLELRQDDPDMMRAPKPRLEKHANA